MKKLISVLFLMLMFSNSVFATATEVITDTAITAEVKVLLFEKKLMNNENYNASDIHVETKNGEVFLTGHVADEAAKSRAAEIVQSAKGVKNVNNQLVIQ